VRKAVLLVLVFLALPIHAEEIRGRVQLLAKGGKGPAKGSDVRQAVVYFEPAGSPAVRPPETPFEMVTKRKAFAPRVLVVPKGSRVRFPNQDPILHNVFSVSGENRFDLDLYKRPKVGRHTFENPGVVRVSCNIHPQMAAFVIVRDNGFFTKAAEDGTYRIPNVPAGKYTVKAWHERGGEAAAEVTVAAQGDAHADFNLDASKFKVIPHKNKNGKDYSTDEKY